MVQYASNSWSLSRFACVLQWFCDAFAGLRTCLLSHCTNSPAPVQLAVQAIEDDIGDKSVFELMKLPAEEQQRKLAEMGRGS